MKDLYRRLVVGPIAIGLAASLLLLSFHPFFQYAVVLAIALLGAIAAWEYEQFAKAKGGQIISSALIAFTLCEVVSFYLAAKNPAFASFPILIFFLGFLLLFALHFGKKEGAIVDLAVSSFGLLYIAVPMGMLLGILYSPEINGRWWIVYLLVVTKITDIGAYFAGNLWGKRKLAPTISPKKTIEGAFFGLVCAVGASFLFRLCSGYIGSIYLGTYEWLILALILGAVGQFGDLSESLLKRDANKKDSNTLPGLGGVLDSLDSILFNATIIYIYLHFLKL